MQRSAIEVMSSDYGLEDAFTGGVINTTLWQVNGITVTETSTLNLAGSTDAWLRSVSAYNLTNKYAIVEFVDVPVAASTYTQQFLFAPSDAFASYIFLQVTNDQVKIHDSNLGLISTTFFAADNRFFRFRSSGTTIYFDTSPDGSSWTNRHSWTTTVTITSMYVYLRHDVFTPFPTVTHKFRYFSSNLR